MINSEIEFAAVTARCSGAMLWLNSSSLTLLAVGAPALTSLLMRTSSLTLLAVGALSLTSLLMRILYRRTMLSRIKARCHHSSQFELLLSLLYSHNFD